MRLPGDTGLTIVTYNAEPGTPGADGLELLASRAATDHRAAGPAGSGAGPRR
jgi:hypothetical protein